MMLKPESTRRLRPNGVNVIRLPRKSSKHIDTVPVPQTDTGSRGENPKVLERFMAKELGKIIL